jgi:penicillin-binding protein 1A
MQDTENKKPKKKLKYIIVLWLLFIMPIISIWLIMFLASHDYLGKLPSFEELENPKSNLATEIFSADQEVIGRYYRENRVNVDFENISPHVINALIATEDERYYSHSGIDFRSLGRVLMGVLTGSTRGGGSTISQQLAKMLFHNRSKSKLERATQKFKEWVIATRLEKQYTKDEIISMYLNKFDFVNNAVGIKTASNVYFNTSPDSLQIHQAAMLVGMAKNPALFNPVRRPEQTLDRRNVVLYQMMRNKYLDEETYDSLKLLPLDLDFKRVDHKTGLAPYFREVLRMELRKLFSEKDPITGEYKLRKPDGEPYDIYSDGLKIYTTLDSRMQLYAEKAVEQHLGKELQKDFFNDLKKRKNAPFDWRLSDEKIKQTLNRAMKQTHRYREMKAAGIAIDSIEKAFETPVEMTVFSWYGDVDTTMSPMDSIRYYKSFLQTGLMSMDPSTGFIKAWVGGANFDYFNYDHVYQARRQVGSTFKPMVYALAMQEGYSPCYEVPNTKTCFQIPAQPDWCPKNSDDNYGGIVSLKYGLANSINTVTAWVMKQFGPKALVEFARKVGITSPMEEVPALCLGVCDLSVYEIVGANATFANKGMWTQPMFLTRIVDKNGNVIKEFKPETREAMSEETAYIMINMMKGVIDGAYNKTTGKTTGTGMRLRFRYGFENEIAGKTGTTQNNSDGWFIGLTPELVTGIWVGAADRSVRFSRTYYGQGANTSLPIWALYMKQVYADKKLNVSKAPFEKPKGGVSVELDCKKYKQQGSGSQSFGDEFN